MARLVVIGCLCFLVGNYIKTSLELSEAKKTIKTLEVELENALYQRDQCRLMWKLC